MAKDAPGIFISDVSVKIVVALKCSEVRFVRLMEACTVVNLDCKLGVVASFFLARGMPRPSQWIAVILIVRDWFQKPGSS